MADTIDGRHVIFQGEMQLMRWAESSTTGATVTMWIHPEDLEAFKLLKARSGKHAGQRLGVVMVQIGDDEAVVEHADEPATVAASPAPTASPAPAQRAYRRPAIGDLGMCAVLWCKLPAFWQWLGETFDESVVTEADAKEVVLIQSRVVELHPDTASRKWLDTDPACSKAFLDRIFRPFGAYARENGIKLGKDDHE